MYFDAVLKKGVNQSHYCRHYRRLRAKARCLLYKINVCKAQETKRNALVVNLRMKNEIKEGIVNQNVVGFFFSSRYFSRLL